MNISKTFLLGGMLAGSLALLQPASGQAQYTGPSTHHAPATVAEILKNPVDDQDVVLRGHLLRKVGNEKYIFSDGTGEIRVEIEAEDFPPEQIDDKAQVEIRGEVEKDFLDSPEIDVEALRKLP
ncbi:NirD/YgiW/YdeI family stress tolerance protein [Azoarcus sp. TTM-91]|uniref:YgiW/YdeI family stress tolerance OB fold protein n=1 Tax=Azoarcus sp. TTM-91 TaxID=2691581 RepID=UPI001B7CF5B4|nr:NirD/YgiW/YdeI family stress tolerance protein [Azoarcus sp. TTM-91]